METRKITVVSTKTQKKSVIMSAATTLGELKADLRDANIDYTDMTFYEGTSKTELKTDDSILPHDVPYKGTITNELVFMLTNTNKKIKSGADLSRAELYDQIKKKGLQDRCKELYGKNFTMCKTVELLHVVEKYNKSSDKSSKSLPKSLTPCTTEKDNSCKDVETRNAIATLVNILVEEGCITSESRDIIMATIHGTTTSTEFKPTSSSPYSDDEIDAMFRDM